MSRGWGVFVSGAVIVGSVAIAACGNDDGGDAEVTAAQGKEVFTRAACSSCHTLADAGAAGTIGVNFDETKPNAVKVEQFVRNGSPPTMPSFEGTLTDAEIEAVALYVQEASGAEPIEE